MMEIILDISTATLQFVHLLWCGEVVINEGIPMIIPIFTHFYSLLLYL